ncbi:MAG TPA: septum site-determining protein Ssd [Frankiaceae bacterium]|nr:septum site-determining protein Ssd [Frankiaceae bacterium]
MRRRAAAPTTSRPLLVSDRIEIVDALLDRLPDGAPAPDVAAEPRAARRGWSAASVVLVDPDLLAPLARSRLPRRPGVVLLLPGDERGGDEAGPDSTGPDWAAGLRLGIERALDLDEAAAWLASASTAPRLPSAARLLTVTGACGGCGASSLACALGVSGARRGLRTLLVDLDPLGGGLDIALGLEDSPGPRWPEVVELLTRKSPDSVVRALPGLPLPTGTGSLRLLSAGRAPASQEPLDVASGLGLLVEAVELLVIDLPRHADAEQVPDGGQLLLVVPDQVRACAAAAARVTLLSAAADDIRLVVRDTGGSLAGASISDALALPVAGRCRTQSGLTAEVERGIPPGTRPRSVLAQLSGTLLDGVADRPVAPVR